jgi:hypothetical protein
MMLNDQPFIENKDAGAFAQAIVDTVREPLLVLDLRGLAASCASTPSLGRGRNPLRGNSFRIR